MYQSTRTKEDEALQEELIQQEDIRCKLTEEQKVACEGALTLEECYESLKCFKQNKSPGCDGIPAEFYLEFCPEIGPKLLECLNYCSNKGTLFTSQRNGLLPFLRKKRQRFFENQELEAGKFAKY